MSTTSLPVTMRPPMPASCTSPHILRAPSADSHQTPTSLDARRTWLKVAADRIYWRGPQVRNT
ncbi:hypothetical protein BD309DRAFT_944835 [Dichomitus squalens]|uniref:Uncharacterized protein n=1 Tax=Dichomitus squalens TaxID=114155 RepID=A0A4V2K643_9APHY|nr:hypothetical protein BD309DRAFT_944835 [Dichomitus squalens]TBU65744.1 hypothetical protein BD310DRAFT_911974 [Dichomitus squalens]